MPGEVVRPARRRRRLPVASRNASSGTLRVDHHALVAGQLDHQVRAAARRRRGGACSVKSQRSTRPASSTARRRCISPHRPRTCGLRSAVDSDCGLAAQASRWCAACRRPAGGTGPARSRGRGRGRASGRRSRSRPSRTTASPAARSCSASTERRVGRARAGPEQPGERAQAEPTSSSRTGAQDEPRQSSDAPCPTEQCSRTLALIDHPAAVARNDARRRGQSARSTTTGAWSEAPVPARSSRSMNAPGHPRRRATASPRTKSIRMPAVPLEALPVVVPVGVDLRARRVRPHHVDVPVLEEARERRALRRGHVGVLRERRHVEDVVVLRRDVPVADQGGVLAEPAAGGVAQPGQPVELVDVVRVVDLAAVGHVERPHAYAAAGRADRPRLGGDRVPEPGHPGEAASGRPRCPTRLMIATPFHWLWPTDGDLVAHRLQPHQRQLVLAGLGLLQGEHVDVVALEERLDAVDPGAEGVDVPGRDAHPPRLAGAPQRLRAAADPWRRGLPARG